MTKTCSKCNVEKDLSEYNKHKTCKYGVFSFCRECDKKQKRAKFKSLSREERDKRNRHYRKYYWNNVDKERARKKAYRKDNLHKDAENTARRRARVKQTMYPEEKAAIQEFYKNCPNGYHVDHIVPLRGKEVSGLHVLSNLQYLPAEENLRKGNKYGS